MFCPVIGLFSWDIGIVGMVIIGDYGAVGCFKAYYWQIREDVRICKE